MSFEGELITFSLPANETILKFLRMKQIEQLKAIELGMRFMSVGTKQLQGWDNAEWKVRLDKDREKYNEIIEKSELMLRKEKDTIQTLKQNHSKELLEASARIKEQTHVYYQTEVSSLREHLERKDEKISQLNKENRNAFKEAFDIFDRKASLREQSWENRISGLRVEYENKLLLEKQEKESLIARTQNSTIIGQDGENFTLCELNRRFPKAEIEDTHKQSGRGILSLKKTTLAC